MRVKNENLLIASGPVDLSVAQELTPVWLGHIASYSLQLVFDGTPVGTFKLQCSSDEGHIDSAGRVNKTSQIENWTDIVHSEAVVDEAGDITWDVQDASYPWVRVVWAPTGGSGSIISARAYVKGI